jgi:lipopolysaccharide export system permease protein
LGGRLDRYIGGLFAMSYSTSCLLVVGLGIVIHIASNLSFFEESATGTAATTWELLEFYALSAPFFYVQFSPLVTVIAGMFTVARLAKKNELTAGLSAGVSAQRLLSVVFIGGVLAACVTFAIREYSSAAIGERRDALGDRLEHQRSELVLSKFWFRDINGNAVRLGEYRPGTSVGAPAEGLHVEATLTRRGVLLQVAAERIYWIDDGERLGWIVEGGVVRESGDARTEEPLTWLDGRELASSVVNFTPSDVLLAEKARSRVLELSFSEVLRLSSRDPDNTSYQTLLQYLMTFPLANVLLLLCTLPFLVGRERGKASEGVMAGLLICLAYFCLDFITRSMGLSGDLSPLMSAWLPVLFFGALGITLTHFMRS